MFKRCLMAYLTGWLIVQPTYNRLHAAWRRRELRNPSGETRAYFREQARAVVAELHAYKAGGQEAPVALDVIVGLHAEIGRLRQQVADLEQARVEEANHG